MLQENLRKAREQNAVATPASPPALPGPIEEATQALKRQGETKRTQSNRTETFVSTQIAQKCAVSALAPARNEANAVQTVDTLRDVPPQPVPPGSADCDKPSANGYES